MAEYRVVVIILLSVYDMLGQQMTYQMGQTLVYHPELLESPHL